MQVKVKVLKTDKAIFCSFSQKLPLRGIKSKLMKNKIRKKYIEEGFQPLPLIPMIFIKPETLTSIEKRLKKQSIAIEVDVSDLLNFNILKEELIKIYTQ